MWKGSGNRFWKCISQIQPSRIAVNYSIDSEICDGITHGMFLTLMELLGELQMQDRVVSAEQIISALRQRKTPGEITFMKNAIQITEVIFDRVAEYIRPGMTEQQVADFMRREVEGRGIPFAWDPQMCPAVFTGPDTAGAHYTPTGRVVQQGHILNMDFGVKYNGYCSDLQRTFYVLKPGKPLRPRRYRRDSTPSYNRSNCQSGRSVPGSMARALMRLPGRSSRTPGTRNSPMRSVIRWADIPMTAPRCWGRLEKYRRKPFLPLEKNMVFTLEPRLDGSRPWGRHHRRDGGGHG